jgi:multiple sugar transport system substrate-binding protein
MAAPTDTAMVAAAPTNTAAAPAAPTDTAMVAAAPTATTAAAAAPTATAAPIPTVAAEATVSIPAATIRVGSWESGAALDLWNGLIANFNKLYPQITISFEPVPDNYGTKLLTQIAANDAPDVFQVGDGDVRMFVERGGAADLTDYIKGKDNLPGVDTAAFYPALFQTGQVDG